MDLDFWFCGDFESLDYYIIFEDYYHAQMEFFSEYIASFYKKIRSPSYCCAVLLDPRLITFYLKSITFYLKTITFYLGIITFHPGTITFYLKTVMLYLWTITFYYCQIFETFLNCFKINLRFTYQSVWSLDNS